MSGKKIVNLIIAFIVLEVIVLYVFGGVGAGSGEEPKEWFKAGPVTFMKHGMVLETIGEVEKIHLVPTPEGKDSFWDVDIVTVKMIVIVDILMLIDTERLLLANQLERERAFAEMLMRAAELEQGVGDQ